MIITQERVLLQYGATGEKISGYSHVHVSEAHKFVDLDSASGGYPYATEIHRAYDFGTAEKAAKYAGHFPGFKIRHVKVTYEVSE